MKLLLTILFTGCALFSSAQKKLSGFEKYGQITAAHLNVKEYDIDKEAGAVVLNKRRDLSIVGNVKGGFSLEDHFHSVIHILNKKSYDEATIEIPLYKNEALEEKIVTFKAVTYNLENEKISETKMKKGDIIYEKVDKNRILAKFTMPQVKEGSIIEFDYVTNSDFLMVPDTWYFQSTAMPVLWSEMTFTVPDFYDYRQLQLGYHRLYINERKSGKNQFTVMDQSTGNATDKFTFTTNVAEYRWVMIDIPALKEESYTRSVKNHIARMELLLMTQREPLKFHNYSTTWQEVMRDLNKSESFGQKLNANNNWLGDELKPLYSKTEDKLEKAKSIYAYVRDQYSHTDGGGIYMSDNLKNVFKAKKGKPAELNLLLTAMLRYAGINANPVVLSTAEHGYAFDYTPMISSMNYVIVQTDIDGKRYYLDASKARLGFDKLPINCYNGNARIVDDEASSILLTPDSIKESEVNQYFMFADPSGSWKGNARKQLGYYQSYSLRNKIVASGKEDYLKELKNAYPQNMSISDLEMEALTDLDEPMTVSYNIAIDKGDDDIIYLNPTFNEGFK
ncbi:MAG: transglutaminase domain-containing protein, partial [Ginsengibacter sp.]